LALIGYYYSAQQLAVRFQKTLFMGLACVLIHAIVSRWFLVKRRRIAMDLHDQTLSDLAQLQRGLQEIDVQDGEEEKLGTLQQELKQAMGTLREVMENLHPQTLEILGLGAAITSHIERLHSRPGLPEYNLYISPDVEKAGMKRLTKLTLYRITVEAIHNVLKHSRANRYEVALEVRDNELVLTVEDNGGGFTNDAPANGSGRGLHNMRERARAIGATIDWRASRFSTGTCFELRLPLSPSSTETES
jgi:signal transduction histidine kinase